SDGAHVNLKGVRTTLKCVLTHSQVVAKKESIQCMERGGKRESPEREIDQRRQEEKKKKSSICKA
ncbi:hypothetical protein Taro_040480, partial [Colocasia esculenta]|nr:hypothetical protein [Colocasia esculenta]